MEETSWDVAWYLDLETGRVVAVDAETRRELEAIYEDTPDSGGGEPDDFARVLEQRDLPPWMIETIIEADLVERGFGGRFLPVPRTDSREAYRDMEDFISTLQDVRLRDRLSRATQERGVFGRFRDVIAESPRDRERWFEFKNRRVRERVTEWLVEEEVDARIEFEVQPEPVVLEAPLRSLLIELGLTGDGRRGRQQEGADVATTARYLQEVLGQQLTTSIRRWISDR